MEGKVRKVVTLGLSLVIAVHPIVAMAVAEDITFTDGENIQDFYGGADEPENNEIVINGTIQNKDIDKSNDDFVSAEDAQENFLNEDVSVCDDSNNSTFNFSTYTYGNYEYSINNENVIITRYTGTENVVEIPSVIDGYTVTSIGTSAFAGCKELEKVTFNEGLENIGTRAFSGCNNLKNIVLPESLITLGEYVFTSPYITSIVIPKNVMNMGSMKSSDICFSPFKECMNLEEVIFEEGITKIPDRALDHCHSVKKVVIPEGIKTIGAYSLSETAIETIELPSTLETIGYASMEECESLTTIVLPVNVKSIGSCAFFACKRLEEVAFNEGLESIETQAFDVCNNLKNIVLPESLTTLGCNVFSSPYITSVVIPKNVTNMDGTSYFGNASFGECENLEKVIFEEGMTKIPDGALYYCDSVKEVIIPEGVKTIGAYSLRRTAIETIELPSTLETIEDNSIKECKSLTTVILPANVKSIGRETFSGCSNLKIVQISKKVTAIGEDSFSGCSDVSIYGYSGSYAEIYANDNNIPFVVLDDEEEESGKGFNLTRDGHCVINAASCFSYDSWTNWFGINGYKIPLERYQEVYGDSYTKHIYDQNISSWNGNCFGMSATAALFYKGKLPVADYTHDVGVLASGGYDDMVSSEGKTYLKLKKNSDLTKLIERYQIWQDSNEFYQSYVKDILNYESGTDAEALSNVVNKIRDTKEPFLVLIHWDESDDLTTAGHALVVDSSRTPQDLGNDWVRIYLYDPNNPYFEYFDKKTPFECYTQAENRFLDVNVSSGQWRMAAMVNGDGASQTSIGYDNSGNRLKNSTIAFVDVNDYPTSFNQKATFSSSGDTTNITYASDNFEVHDSSNMLVYKMKNGEVSYIDDEIVKHFVDYGYIAGLDSGISNGKLILPKGQYSVTVDKGAISYMTDNDYSGIVAKERTVVKNIDSTTLSITSVGTNKVNVVIEDRKSGKYTSVETDIVANDNACEISLNKDKLSVNTGIEQQVDVSVISDKEEKRIEDVQIDNSTNIELGEEHSWDLGKVTKKATCIEKGVKTYTCTVCGEIKTEEILALGHKYGSWKITKAATVLKKGIRIRSCSNCGGIEKRDIEKIKPTAKINVSSVPLRVKQSTTKVKVMGLAKGDYIKTWKSSNTKIVTVNAKGKITAKNKTGKATITVTMASGLKKNIKVTVQKSAVVAKKITGISKAITLRKGKTITLRPVISPITVTSKTTYTSSNKKVVIVNSKGKITAKKKGTAIITVKNGKKTAKCKVTVK